MPTSWFVYYNSAILIVIVNVFKKHTFDSILSDDIESMLTQLSLKVINTFFKLGVIINFKANNFTVYCVLTAIGFLLTSNKFGTQAGCSLMKKSALLVNLLFPIILCQTMMSSLLYSTIVQSVFLDLCSDFIVINEDQDLD